MTGPSVAPQPEASAASIASEPGSESASVACCPRCGFLLSSIHGDEWWCERCPWDGTERDRLASLEKRLAALEVAGKTKPTWEPMCACGGHPSHCVGPR